uniref:CSON008484 protein n=1 Tax=Culicoides sonorensis TaxID=179676 RepID=A0A336LZ00_CULSO
MKAFTIIFIAIFCFIQITIASNIREKRHVFTDAVERIDKSADRVWKEFARVFGRENRHFSEIADRASHRLMKTGEEVVRTTGDVYTNMNAKILIAICMVFLVQNTYAGITKRDAPAAAPAKPADLSNILTEGPLADLFKTAQETVATLQSRFLELAGVKNNDELIESVQTKANTYAETVNGLLKTVQEEALKQAGTLNETITGLVTKLQGTVTQLQEQNPELVKATQEYKDTVTKQFAGIVQETRKLAEAIQGQAGGVSEQLNTAVKGIVQETASTATQIVQKVDMAIKQKHDFPEKPAAQA